MELDGYLGKIRQAGSQQEVFSILDDFRKQEWTDEQRSKVAKLYMRMLENLAPAQESAAAEPAKDAKGKGAKPVKEAPAGAGKPADVAKEAAATNMPPQPVAPQPTEFVEQEEVWYEKM